VGVKPGPVHDSWGLKFGPTQHSAVFASRMPPRLSACDAPVLAEALALASSANVGGGIETTAPHEPEP
jgi:hypothetical protein